MTSISKTDPPARCVVGTFGWDHDAWSDTYYPPDLPGEWRLPYYANDFTGVLVPEESWVRSDPNTLAGWLDDVPAGFRFFLEAPPNVPKARADRPDWPRQALGGAFGGWVTTGAEPSHAPHGNAKPEDRQTNEPPVTLLMPEDLADQRQLGRLLVNLSQRPIPPTAIFVMRTNHPAKAVELRTLAELAGLA